MALMQLSSAYLDTHYQDTFSQALKTVLASTLTEITMAQLVDGLPEVDIARQTCGHHITGLDHPLLAHEQLCEGVMEKTLALRDTFKADDLSFESHLLQEYSKTEVDSKAFKLRLLEMIAVAVHQIAVELFKLSPKSHSPEFITQVTEWQQPTGWVEWYGRKQWEEPLFPPPETHFLHDAYTDSDIYPHGVADMAGYWAEDRIFGGVVVFDRGESGKECREVFLHPSRRGETFRIWRLNDSQLNMLIEYLLSGTAPDNFSLPLLATDQNIYRYDPWDAMAYYRTFRDPWERRIPLEKPAGKDVIASWDYPERAGFIAAVVNTTETGRTTVWEPPSNPYPPPADRSWIYAYGGHMGHPLRSQQLVPKGPPQSGSPSVSEDGGSDSGESVNSWVAQYQNGAISDTVDNEGGLLSGADMLSDALASGDTYSNENNVIIRYLDTDEDHPDGLANHIPPLSGHENELEEEKHTAEESDSKKWESTNVAAYLATPDCFDPQQTMKRKLNDSEE